MKKYSFKIMFVGALFALLTLASCLDDLDTVPNDPDFILAEDVFDDPAAYKQVLAKLYAGLAISGQEGPAGLPDISGIDEGFSQYLRQYWLAQEVQLMKLLLDGQMVVCQIIMNMIGTQVTSL